jgi:histidinol dehydrogenase
MNLNRFAIPDTRVRDTVSAILDDVRLNGDEALLAYTEKFDKTKLTSAQLALKGLSAKPEPKVANAITYALRNIQTFARARMPKSWDKKNSEGARVGEQYTPYERVGIYVPGGTAPLVSTALMTVGIAKAAGVDEIVVVTPPPVNPTLHYAIRFAGATEIYQVGGAQAIAALAFGTKTIRRVNKIVGPGNAYVAEAKRQVVGAVSIDMIAGPSEIAILADSTANASFIAADLLAQAEHGHGSQVLFVTTSNTLWQEVQDEVKQQAATLSRQQYLQETLKDGSSFVLVKSMAEGVRVINDYAPEHLAVFAKEGRALLKQIRNAGAIFVGNYSPVAAGDYISGPSHTLPTGGAAKSFAGLTVDQFFKRTSVVEYTKAALEEVADKIETLALLEQLDAHARSARIRLR